MTYKELNEAYMDRCFGNQEPHTLLVHPDYRTELMKLIGYWTWFNAATIKTDHTLDIPYKFIGGVEPGSLKKEFML